MIMLKKHDIGFLPLELVFLFCFVLSLSKMQYLCKEIWNNKQIIIDAIREAVDKG